MRLLAAAMALTLASRAAFGQVETTETGFHPRAGIAFGAPAIFAISGGVALVTRADKDHWREFFLMIAPGYRAGRIQLGIGDWDRGGLRPGDPGLGYMARLSFMRRWYRNVNYAGIEISLPVVGPRLGIYMPIRNSSERIRLTLDLIVGW